MAVTSVVVNLAVKRNVDLMQSAENLKAVHCGFSLGEGALGLRLDSYPSHAGIVARTRYVAIIFITGVSAAGKSTAYKTLRGDADLSDIEFRDIDEDGIPAAGSGPWRVFRIELLLHLAVTRYRETGRSTVICGVTNPHEVVESGAFPSNIPVHFVMVDASPANIRKRLRARLDGRQGWTDQDVEFSVLSNLRLRDLLRRSVLQQRNGIVLDPGRGSRATVCRQLKSIIQQTVSCV